MTTEELAKALGLKQASIRWSLCKTGTYFGLVPRRLPNDRLVWPDDAVDRLLATKVKPRARPTPRTREAA